MGKINVRLPEFMVMQQGVGAKRDSRFRIQEGSKFMGCGYRPVNFVFPFLVEGKGCWWI